MHDENIVLEEIKNKDKFKNYRPLESFLDKSIDTAIKKIDIMIQQFGERFPDSSSSNSKYKVIDNIEWTTSFWTGLLWLAYEHTGDNKYKELADKHLDDFDRRIERKGKDVQNHDLGFMYTLSSVANYKLTGNTKAKETAKKATDFLITRYHDKAHIIQAWGDLNDPSQLGRMIIDCNMNLPLLYWTSEEFYDSKYKEIAYNHVKQAQKYIVRPDASTYHTYHMNVDTGEPIKGSTHQGFSDDSCWARGQAWAIYGFMLSYAYTKDNSFIELVKKLTNYFLNRLPDDLVCYWDLSFGDGSGQPRDSSSNAIVACGLLEMIKYLPISDKDRDFYKDVCISMLDSLSSDEYLSHDENEDGILKHSSYGVPQKNGVDEFCIWGDYYYLEALIRMKYVWNVYW